MAELETGAVTMICLRGRLDERRARQFEGLTIVELPGGITLLAGQVPDQAALFGLLSRVRDLGVPLLLVQRITTGRGHDE